MQREHYVCYRIDLLFEYFQSSQPESSNSHKNKKKCVSLVEKMTLKCCVKICVKNSMFTFFANAVKPNYMKYFRNSSFRWYSSSEEIDSVYAKNAVSTRNFI